MIFCGSELAREEAGTSACISDGSNIAFASKVERHPGRPTGPVFAARQRRVRATGGLPQVLYPAVITKSVKSTAQLASRAAAGGASRGFPELRFRGPGRSRR